MPRAALTNTDRAHGTRSDCRVAPRAFTLIELLLVMAVIAVIAGMAVPRYGSSVGRYRAESAARRVIADLALARATARAASSARVVTFNTTANGYTLSDQYHLDDSTRPYTVSLGAGPYHATLHYADFGGVPRAEFDMYGNCLWAGRVIVRAGSHERVVDVPSGAGEVRLN